MERGKSKRDGVVLLELPPSLAVGPDLNAVLQAMTTCSRKETTPGVEVSMARSAYSEAVFEAVVHHAATTFRHAAYVTINLAHATLPSGGFTVLSDRLLLTRFTHLRLNLTGLRLSVADVHALLRLAPILEGLTLREGVLAPDVLGTLVDSLGSMTQLKTLDLSKVFFVRRSPRLFRQFVAHATTPAPGAPTAWPLLASLYLEHNALPTEDTIALLSALAYAPSLTHLSLAYSVPTVDLQLGAWLALTLLHNPLKTSPVTSVNLAGISIQHDVALSLATAPVAAHLADGQLMDLGLPRFVAAPPGTVIYGSGLPVPRCPSVLQVLGATASHAAVLVPGHGVAHLALEAVGPAVVPRLLSAAYCEQLVLDDLKPAGILLPALHLLPAPHRLRSLRLRRYALATGEAPALVQLCTGLRALDLKACRVTDIMGLLPALPRLMHLNLHKNLIGATGAVHLAGALRETTTQLVSLNVSRNMIGEVGLTAIGSALVTNRALECLVIDNCTEPALRTAILQQHLNVVLRVISLDAEAKWAFVLALTWLHRRSVGKAATEKTRYSQLLDPTLMQNIIEFAGSPIVRCIVDK
ncbi:hypothetical protein ACHHYP_16091 [Achlya hypogyna]|uniref:Uncharacterized protein n=1 Tax=Achlya hypogyna TaxID=1202772 RepID=A0A1V9Y9I9_ACHHY|nr:hypothetical protein ACHHYP_16091 [Achlya hypogyna]